MRLLGVEKIEQLGPHHVSVDAASASSTDTAH